MQLYLGAVRAFKGYVDFLAVESEGPLLRFAVPENSSLHLKRMVVEPAPFDGIDAVGRRRLPNSPSRPMDPPNRAVGRSSLCSGCNLNQHSLEVMSLIRKRTVADRTATKNNFHASVETTRRLSTNIVDALRRGRHEVCMPGLFRARRA